MPAITLLEVLVNLANFLGGGGRAANCYLGNCHCKYKCRCSYRCRCISCSGDHLPDAEVLSLLLPDQLEAIWRVQHEAAHLLLQPFEGGARDLGGLGLGPGAGLARVRHAGTLSSRRLALLAALAHWHPWLLTTLPPGSPGSLPSQLSVTCGELFALAPHYTDTWQHWLTTTSHISNLKGRFLKLPGTRQPMFPGSSCFPSWLFKGALQNQVQLFNPLFISIYQTHECFFLSPAHPESCHKVVSPRCSQAL